MTDATPMLSFVTDVMNSLGPYLITGLAFALGVPFAFLVVRLVRAGTRGWPSI